MAHVNGCFFYYQVKPSYYLHFPCFPASGWFSSPQKPGHPYPSPHFSRRSRPLPVPASQHPTQACLLTTHLLLMRRRGVLPRLIAGHQGHRNHRPMPHHPHHPQVGCTPWYAVRHHFPKRHAFERAHIIDLLPHYHTQHLHSIEQEGIGSRTSTAGRSTSHMRFERCSPADVIKGNVDALTIPGSQPPFKRHPPHRPPFPPAPYISFPLNVPFHCAFAVRDLGRNFLSITTRIRPEVY